jgi:hypothetical protein
MVGELKLVVAAEFFCVASALVLRMAVESVPVVRQDGRGAFVYEVAGTLVAFKRSSASSQ